MPRNSDLFINAGSKSTRQELLGAAWPVYEDFEVERYEVEYGGEKLYEDVFVYAPFRPPPSKPGTGYSSDNAPQDEGLKRLYAPLRDVPDLFLRFAGLARKGPLTEDEALAEMLKWIMTYGVLGLEAPYYAEPPERIAADGGRYQSLKSFTEAVRMAAWCAELYEAATAPGGPNAAVLEKCGALGDKLGEKREWALATVSQIVGKRVREHCYPVLYRKVVNDTDGKVLSWAGEETVGFEQGWGFTSLFGAMYLQMMVYMIEGGEGRRCKRDDCYRLVTFDPPRPAGDPGLKRGARGKYRTRRDKEFCSKACAQWWSDNYGNSKKARRKRGELA